MTTSGPPKFQPDEKEAERLQKSLWIAVALGVMGIVQLAPIVGSVFAVVLGLSARGRDVDQAYPALQARARLAINLGGIGLLVTLALVMLAGVRRYA